MQKLPLIYNNLRLN